MKTTSNDSSPSLTSLEDLTTPLSLMQSPEQQDKLQAVLELFQDKGLWEALERVLRLEQLWHLREAAFQYNKDEQFGPDYHRSVAHWLESVLSGALENHAANSAAALKSLNEEPTTLTDLVTNGTLQEQDSGGSYLDE